MQRHHILALLGAIACALAAQAPQIVTAPPGFQVALPHGWRVMSDSILDALQRNPTIADIVLVPGQELVLGLVPDNARIDDLARMPPSFVLFRIDRAVQYTHGRLRGITANAKAQ